jgi:hypothetical protein
LLYSFLKDLPMRVLIACEYSGTVRDAFIRKGHDAMSCDLLPTDVPGPHYQGDVRDVINNCWDLMIAHPPCTYLTVTANKWIKDQPKRKSGALVGAERRSARDEAILFFMLFVNSDIPKIAIENPIGCMSSVFRRPEQIIQPFQFGHSERKATCLWLKGLPKLEPTNIVEPISYIAAGKKYSPTHYNSRRSLNRLDCLPPGEERSKLRSKTYQGIAEAMASQWG